MSSLFEPLSIGPLRLPNRIVIPPMCQYSADEGSATDWHTIHLGHLALSGAGLLVLEATAVAPEGRISACDLGLYSDANERALAALVETLRRHSSMPLAIQLAHAGRKASCAVPWAGGAQIAPGNPGGWPTVGASALPFNDGEVAPRPLDAAGLSAIREQFAAAAKRAVRAGVEAIEIHNAHGYLLHSFLSPLSNRRDDGYGGARERRMRLPLEVFDAVRAAVPPSVAVWVRVSATDWVEGGWSLEDTVAFAQALKARGCAAIHVSTGGGSPAQRIDLKPGFQVPFAETIKVEVGLPTIAVGLITEPAQAEAVLAEGRADAVAIGRAMLYDPRWPWHAAAALGARVQAPPQYWRSAPQGVRDLFEKTVAAR